MNHQTSSNRNRSASNSQPLVLAGQWLAIARAVWLLITLLNVGFFAFGVPLHFQQLITPCAGANCAQGQLASETLPAILETGMTLTNYATIQVGLSLMVAVVFVGMGVLIFWRRSHEWMALSSSLWLITFGLTLFENEVRAVGATSRWLEPIAILFVWLGGVLLLSLFFFIFPNGRFVPNWTKWGWLGTIAIFISFSIVETVWSATQRFYEEVGPQLWGIMILSGIGFQIFRYRRVSTVDERQQTKWVIFAFLGTFVGITSFFSAEAFRVFDHLTLNEALLNIIETAIPAFAFLMIPLGIGISILRYRLYDIDIIIRQTVQYAVVSAVLAAVYFGSITLIQGGITAVTDTQSPLAIVLSTLLIAALFNPLRRRVQAFIDRRFFRKKYNAQQVLAQFAETARDEVEVDLLIDELLGVVQETLQPEQIGLWLHQ